MNYFITRDGQQYGPYTLADLQRYVASGEILLTDLAFSEGMPGPLPVSQIIGTIPVPQPPLPGVQVPQFSMYPDPPNLHWALVLLIGIFTCGLFIYAWDLVQAVWLKKVEPESKALYYYIASAATAFVVFFFAFAAGLHHTHSPVTGFVQIANFVLIVVARFSMKGSLEKHFNSAEPMGLQLSGVMTFFFGGIYFQYHFNDIVRRKNIDRLSGMAV